ncbi:hypothetical protein AKJ57_00390 [candidate division MSBL1 archaeon SCGC-AAA259A05]|uniref:Sulfatase N-terminal domain-containing protein n=1 Tax=candidate division MSBL1 archaeon SCGC-AAA259A05 TaxID=1698259 RepID=A0A133UBS7_9EURY|nr:hypothetical protein AKJ57_00390 [candidate division MSBL1 archaeon SCGC-AAA259A05]
MTDKNIILVTIDALRADHLGFMGYQKNTSPHIDKIAEEGIYYSNAVANAPYTTASIKSMLTSSLPLTPERYLPFPFHRPSLPKVLKKYGYSTYCVHSNPWFTKYNFGHDFDYFLDPLEKSKKKQGGISLPRKLKKKVREVDTNYLNNALSNIKKSVVGVNLEKPYARADVITDKVLNLIPKLDKERFFLWIHYMDVHEPYLPKNKEFNQKLVSNLMEKRSKSPASLSKDEKRLMKKLYDSEIRFVDRQVGEVWKVLNELNSENFLLIITSDHGDELGEHGHYGHVNRKVPAKLYEELLHIPFLLYDPEVDEKGENSELVSLTDLSPTVIDAVGIKKPQSFLGKSVLDSAENRKSVINQAIQCKDPNQLRYMKNGSKLFSYRKNGYKLIWREDGGTKLYNLEKDPEENNNIVQKKAKIAEELKEKLFTEIDKLKENFSEAERVKNKVNRLKKMKKI